MAPDKRLHFLAGLFISVITGLLWGHFVGFALGVAAGVGKEIVDRVLNKIAERKHLPPKHDVDIFDAAFTIFGAAVGGMLSSFIIKVITQWPL